MSAVAACVLLAGGIMKPLVRPAAPSLSRASGEPGHTAALNIADTDATPSPTAAVEQLAAWARPTATPVPAQAPEGEELPRRGPREIRLWNGTVMPVAAARMQPEEGVHRWQLPGATDTVGWHPDTPDCGEGVVVMGGHVSYDGVPGPLANLANVGPDDIVECVDNDGQVHRYVPHDYLVSSVEDDVASWHPEWRPALVLYTCTPELDGTLLVVRFALEQ